ncbi:hypothetical protein DM860_012045 [Cuscuta australis]|uniref:Glycine-rich protein n=1 Tax=Cuscuta australis TaxID=267555 RepID=A0A328D8S2_9ASTE|nr:hypothetical protein DM860_012045 [Cuscuta australis]
MGNSKIALFSFLVLLLVSMTIPSEVVVLANGEPGAAYHPAGAYGGDLPRGGGYAGGSCVSACCHRLRVGCARCCSSGGSGRTNPRPDCPQCQGP